MASYDFESGSSHRIAETATRAYTLAHTHVALVTVESLPGANVTATAISWQSGTGARAVLLGLDGNRSGTLAYRVGATTYAPSTNIIPPTAGEWLLIGATKAAGTVAINFWMYNYTTGEWTEYATSGTAADRTQAATAPNVGAFGAAAYWDGRIAAAMALTRTITQGEWRDLIHGRAAWWAAYEKTAGSPTVGNSTWMDLTSNLPTAPDMGHRYYVYATGTRPSIDMSTNPPGW